MTIFRSIRDLWGDLWGNLWDGLKRGVARSRTIRELHALSDHQLRDIGLMRDQIEAFVDGLLVHEPALRPEPAMRLVVSNPPKPATRDVGDRRIAA